MRLADKAFSILQRDLFLFIANFISSIIVARVLGPDGLGVWVVLSLVPSYAEAFGRLKADHSAVYYLGKDIFRPADILRNLNFIATVSAALILILILLNFDYLNSILFKTNNFSYSIYLMAILPIIPLQFLQLNYSYFHLGEENIAAVNKMVMIQAWSGFILVVSLLLFTKLELWSVIIGAIVSKALALCVGWYLVNTQSKFGGKISWKVCSNLISYGTGFYFNNILSELQQSGTRLIAAYFLGPAFLAFLGQGQNIAIMLTKISDAIGTVLFPRISRSGKDYAIKTACKAFRITAIVLIISATFLFLFSEYLIVLFYGDAFQPTAIVLQILIPGFVFLGLANTLSSYFYGSGKAGTIPMLQLLPISIQLLLSWFFISTWGLFGAAIAISCGFSIYSLLLILYFLIHHRLSIKTILPGPRDFETIWQFCSTQISVVQRIIFRQKT